MYLYKRIFEYLVQKLSEYSNHQLFGESPPQYIHKCTQQKYTIHIHNTRNIQLQHKQTHTITQMH